MSHPRLDFHGDSRHWPLNEDFWSMLASVGLFIIMLIVGIALWRSTPAVQTSTLFDRAAQETTRPTLPTVPY